MTRTSVFAAAVALVICATATGVSAQLAYVQAANQVGQAWLFRKDGKCYALTPRHVVVSTDVVDLRASSTGAGELARARVIARWPDEDLALGLVESGTLKDCGPLLALPLDVMTAVRVNVSGEMRIVDNLGGIGLRPATIAELDDTTLTIRTRSNVVRTLSGSILFLGTTPAGMLVQKPNDDAAEGVGVLLRMDVATRLALDHLNTRLDAPAAPPPSPREAPVRCGSATVDQTDAAAQVNGGSIVSWTALPESPEFGPENLLGDGCRTWQVRRPSYPISVVIDLTGNDPVRLREVVLDASGSATRFAPEEIEVFTRLGAAGGWTSTATARFAASSTRVVIPLTDVPAAQVMIKIHAGRNADRLALSRVVVRRAPTG